MRTKGLTFDTGFISEGTTTREPFDPEIVRREMQIIRDDLHCTAVRVTGGHPDRLERPRALRSTRAWKCGSRRSRTS
jgi:hypothetical protein